jgi:hypothetical protein
MKYMVSEISILLNRRAVKTIPFHQSAMNPTFQEIYYALKEKGFHPFYLPLAIKVNEDNPLLSACIRCDTCVASRVFSMLKLILILMGYAQQWHIPI